MEDASLTIKQYKFIMTSQTTNLYIVSTKYSKLTGVITIFIITMAKNSRSSTLVRTVSSVNSIDEEKQHFFGTSTQY